MSKNSFYTLLDKYQNGNCTPAERQMVEDWYGMLGKQNAEQLSDVELDDIHQRIWLKINPIKTKKLFSWRMVGAAASIIAILGFSFIYIKKNEDPEQVFAKAIDYAILVSKTNQGTQKLNVTLPDNSIATLNPGASIEYPKQFGRENREVYLKGDAFFEVTKNKAKPFLVHNKNLTIRVLGTSFFVKDGQTDNEVLVKTGRVEVKENCRKLNFKPEKAVFVTANQKASFNTNNNKIAASIVNNPIPLYEAYNRPEPADYADSQKFYDTPLDTVFDSISKNYGIDIRLENESLKKCTFTGDIGGKSMKDQLLLICTTIAGKYVVDGTSIIIKGTPCN